MPGPVAIDLETQANEINIQMPVTRIALSAPYLNGNGHTSSSETLKQSNPQQIQVDRSLMEMIVAEHMDCLDDPHAFIMPPLSPTNMMKEIPDFDDYSEDSLP